MNKLTDILDDYVKPPYSLEDSMEDAVSKYCYKSYELLNTIIRNCFMDFTSKKSTAVDEIRKVLTNKGIDENTIAFIVNKIDDIIFTHFDYDEENL